ncbi:MAG: hypothetical protein ACK5KL_03440 [Dysgonomonas sp.]
MSRIFLTIKSQQRNGIIMNMDAVITNLSKYYIQLDAQFSKCLLVPSSRLRLEMYYAASTGTSTHTNISISINISFSDYS